jgi:hypothetical protein
MITTEQHLKGPVNNALIQEFTKKEEITKKQVEVARAKLKVLEVELARPE